jgi:hypothetical protein
MVASDAVPVSVSDAVARMCPFAHRSPPLVQLKELVSLLLEKDIKKRLGCLRGGAGDIKQHKFFSRTCFFLPTPPPPPPHVSAVHGWLCTWLFVV